MIFMGTIITAKSIKLIAGEVRSKVVERQNAAALKDYRIYVDMPRHHGWTLYGKPVKSCRLFTDGPLNLLVSFARRLGVHRDPLQRTFFTNGNIPRYDISEGTRRGAILYGAKNLQTEEEEQIAYAKARANKHSKPDIFMPQQREE